MTNGLGFYGFKLTKEKAMLMAKIAKDIYLDNEDGAPDEKSILESLKKHDTRFMSVTGANKNSAQGALIEHEEFICLAFRGTDEWQDWLDNLSALSTEEPYGVLHSGFNRSCDDIWISLFGDYQLAHKINPRPLYIAGHSLGGGMATIAAAKLAHMDLPFSGVYTFGQPRAAKRDTARMISKDCEGRYFRFQNNNDIVTRIPARLMNYSHVGQCLYITEDKEIHTDPGFWFRFLDTKSGAVEAIKESLLSNKSIDFFQDHTMESYIEGIQHWDFKG